MKLAASDQRRRGSASGMLVFVMVSRTFGLHTMNANMYDVLSVERPVYGQGRLASIAALHLLTGDRMLNLGCGIGLNFPTPHKAVGPTADAIERRR